MSFQSLYKALQRELATIQKKSFIVHAAKELEREKSRLNYQKLQLIKQRVPTTEIDAKITNLQKNGLQPPKFDHSLLRKLVTELDYVEPSKNSHQQKVKLQYLSNISTFLRSQREYTELLERYNPGLTMDQEDKVRRTANKVGLSVPE